MFTIRRDNTGKSVRERGDTIVEVLIAIAVVSLVLGGAYVTTNKSLLATRAAEERGNALKLAESQVEQLKGLAKVDPNAIFGAGTPMPFCIPFTSSGPSGIAAPISADNNNCKVNAAGAHDDIEPIFRISITRGSDGNTFTVTNTWSSVNGDVDDHVRLIYRVYE